MIKRTENCIAALFLVLSLCLSSVQPVFAGGSVSYVGGAEKYLFSPGSARSVSDLFEDLKDAMPGDVLTDSIEVRNDAGGDTIAVYMRSKGAQLSTGDLLSQLHLTVKKGSDILFDSAADKTAQLTEWTYLQTLRPGQSFLLDLELEVPITLGNEFADKAGYIDWEFLTEIFDEPGPIPGPGDDPADPADPGHDPVDPTDPSHDPTDPTDPGHDPTDPTDPGGGEDIGGDEPVDPGVPKTGDETPLGLYMGMLGCSTALLIVLILLRRRKDEDDKKLK